MSTIFKKCRIKTGLNQEEAAKQLGIHPTTLNKYEGGSRYPSGKLLSTMARLYKVHMDTLILDDKSTTNPDSREEEEMYRTKFEEAQHEIISLLKENALLKDQLLGKPQPSKARSKKAN